MYKQKSGINSKMIAQTSFRISILQIKIVCTKKKEFKRRRENLERPDFCFKLLKELSIDKEISVIFFILLQHTLLKIFKGTSD